MARCVLIVASMTAAWLVGCGGKSPAPATAKDGRSAAHAPSDAPTGFLEKPLKEAGPGSKHANPKPTVK